jgi:hypothetical protein
MPRRAEKTTQKRKVRGKLYPLNMRTTFELRQRLEAAASKSGRSLAQEVERRIEDSFRFEPILQDIPNLVENLELLGERLQHDVEEQKRLDQELGRQMARLDALWPKLVAKLSIEPDAPQRIPGFFQASGGPINKSKDDK